MAAHPTDTTTLQASEAFSTEEPTPPSCRDVSDHGQETEFDPWTSPEANTFHRNMEAESEQYTDEEPEEANTPPLQNDGEEYSIDENAKEERHNNPDAEAHTDEEPHHNQPDNAVIAGPASASTPTTFTTPRPTTIQAQSLPPIDEETRARLIREMEEQFNSRAFFRLTGLQGYAQQAELTEVLSQYGKVRRLDFEGLNRDSAIVFMDSKESAEQAKQILHNAPIKAGGPAVSVEEVPIEALLFVGNLQLDVTSAELRRLFEQHGQVERAFIVRSPSTGHSKGYGFVEFANKTQASSAKQALSSYNHRGRSLRIDWSDCKSLESMHSTILFVDRLPKDFTDGEAVKETFAFFGPVKGVHVAMNQMTGTPRGFVFVEFERWEDAERAWRMINFELDALKEQLAIVRERSTTTPTNTSAEGPASAAEEANAPSAEATANQTTPPSTATSLLLSNLRVSFGNPSKGIDKIPYYGSTAASTKRRTTPSPATPRHIGRGTGLVPLLPSSVAANLLLSGGGRAGRGRGRANLRGLPRGGVPMFDMSGNLVVLDPAVVAAATIGGTPSHGRGGGAARSATGGGSLGRGKARGKGSKPSHHGSATPSGGTHRAASPAVAEGSRGGADRVRPATPRAPPVNGAQPAPPAPAPPSVSSSPAHAVTHPPTPVPHAPRTVKPPLPRIPPLQPPVPAPYPAAPPVSPTSAIYYPQPPTAPAPMAYNSASYTAAYPPTAPGGTGVYATPPATTPGAYQSYPAAPTAGYYYYAQYGQGYPTYYGHTGYGNYPQGYYPDVNTGYGGGYPTVPPTAAMAMPAPPGTKPTSGTKRKAGPPVTSAAALPTGVLPSPPLPPHATGYPPYPAAAPYYTPTNPPPPAKRQRL